MSGPTTSAPSPARRGPTSGCARPPTSRSIASRDRQAAGRPGGRGREGPARPESSTVVRQTRASSIKYDLPAARALMAQAGYSPGESAEGQGHHRPGRHRADALVADERVHPAEPGRDQHPDRRSRWSSSRTSTLHWRSRREGRHERRQGHQRDQPRVRHGRPVLRADALRGYSRSTSRRTASTGGATTTRRSTRRSRRSAPPSTPASRTSC